MKRKTIIWVSMIILIAVIAAVVGCETFNPQTNQLEQSANSTATAVARRGDLVVFASGNGEIVPLDETTLKFDDTGVLAELLVSVGDPVSAGDVLARLQVNKSEAQLAAEIATAELAVLENQQALDALYEEADVAAAQALVALENAQAELADLLDNQLEIAQAMQAVAAAQETMEDSEMMLYIYNSSPSDDDIYTAYASLLFKEKEFNELKDEVATLEYKLKSAPNQDVRDRLTDQLNRAKSRMYNQQLVYEAALYKYNTMTDPADPQDMRVTEAQMNTAQLQLAQANQELESALSGPSLGEIALAEAQLAAAQAEWERCQEGPDPQEVTLAEARLQTAQLELQMAQQESLLVDLVAPIDGMVIAVDAVVNQVIDGDDIIHLADTSQPLIEISLDETDFQSAQVGNRVEVVFDALPDDVFAGSIVEISPGLESTFGSQVIKAWALLDESVFTNLFVLPIGLNASVDVISGETHDTVLVSIEALHETSPGNYTVYVQVNDSFEARPVTVGLMDFTSAEITSGLQAGEIVAIEDVDIE